MPIDVLPNHYTYRDVVGITTGRELPTVYFTDGSHFTQCHNRQGNIGHHPAQIHLYFGNVPMASIVNARQQAIVFMQQNNIANTRGNRYSLTCQFLAGNLNVVTQNLVNPPAVPLIAPQNPVAGSRLFEVTFRNGQVYHHISGGYIQSISDFRKMAMILEMRSKTAIKELDATTNNWRFRAAPTPVPA